MVIVRIVPPVLSCRRPRGSHRCGGVFKYRIGIALADSIDELLREEAITPQLAQTIMTQFDHAIINSLKKMKSKAKFTAACKTFNHVDEVYKFNLKNVSFTMEGSLSVKVPDMRIIACKSGVADPEAEAKAERAGAGGGGAGGGSKKKKAER